MGNKASSGASDTASPTVPSVLQNGNPHPGSPSVTVTGQNSPQNGPAVSFGNGNDDQEVNDDWATTIPFDALNTWGNDLQLSLNRNEPQEIWKSIVEKIVDDHPAHKQLKLCAVSPGSTSGSVSEAQRNSGEEVQADAGEAEGESFNDERNESMPDSLAKTPKRGRKRTTAEAGLTASETKKCEDSRANTAKKPYNTRGASKR